MSAKRNERKDYISLGREKVKRRRPAKTAPRRGIPRTKAEPEGYFRRTDPEDRELPEDRLEPEDEGREEDPELRDGALMDRDGEEELRDGALEERTELEELLEGVA